MHFCSGDLGLSSIALFALLHGLSAIQIVLHNNNTIHRHSSSEYEDGSKTLDADADPNTAWTTNNVIYHVSKC